MDRSAQEAMLTPTGNDIGHLPTRVLYHFHCAKSLHRALVKGHEQRHVSGVNEQK